jgi:hypothetical protein
MSKGTSFTPTSSRRSSSSFETRKQKERGDKGDDEPKTEEQLMEEMFPDYAYPIVYHFITHDELTHLRILDNYLVVQTNACSGMAYPYGGVAGQRIDPFLSSPHEMGILFMRWDIADHLDTLKAAQDKTPYQRALTDFQFLNQHILGHAKILHHPPYLAIYNVCKHSQTIRLDQTNAFITINPRETHFGSIGFELFTALLTAAELMPSSGADTLWLGIDLANPEFSKVAKIYTVSGFSDPFITKTNVNGAQLPINILQLTRPLHTHESRHLESENNFNQVMSLVTRFRLSTMPVVNCAGNNARIMRHRFSFDRSCILSLRLFPYVSFDTSRSAVGITQKSAQRETSGKFVSIKTIYDPDLQTWHDVLAMETTVVSPGRSHVRFVVGTADSVPMQYGEATFHTHPISNYHVANTPIGPPSGDDFLVFVDTFVRFQSPQKIHEHQSFKFSLISTVEGVYIVSLTPDGIIHFTTMQRANPNPHTFAAKTKAITDRYEYTFVDRPVMVWQFHPLSELRSQDAVLAHADDYKRWFDTVNAENGNLFECNFVPWDEFNTRHQIEVVYLENRINLP